MTAPDRPAEGDEGAVYCDGWCSRKSTDKGASIKVVCDEMMPAMPRLGINEPWRFTYRLCRWCRARHTRQRMRLENHK